MNKSKLNNLFSQNMSLQSEEKGSIKKKERLTIEILNAYAANKRKVCLTETKLLLEYFSLYSIQELTLLCALDKDLYQLMCYISPDIYYQAVSLRRHLYPASNHALIFPENASMKSLYLMDHPYFISNVCQKLYECPSIYSISLLMMGKKDVGESKKYLYHFIKENVRYDDLPHNVYNEIMDNCNKTYKGMLLHYKKTLKEMNKFRKKVQVLEKAFLPSGFTYSDLD